MEIDSCNIICPYCESNCCDGSSFFEGYDSADDIREYKCDECGKKFYVERCVTVDYRTERDCKLNSEECEAGEYHCINCDSYDVNIKTQNPNGDEKDD